jgi:hypothetical protein
VLKGSLTCVAESGPFAQTYDTCDAENDSCAPGNICLVEDDTRPACGAHCYRHCRADADCQKIDLNSKCNIDIKFPNGGFEGKACSSAPEVCNPWGAAQCTSGQRPYPTFACYVVTQTPDLVTCECAGSNPVGKACMFEHDCEPGAECVALATGSRVCLKVCVVGALLEARGACPQPPAVAQSQKCTRFANGTKYGYCVPM